LLPAFAKGDDYLRFWSGAADPNATPSRAPWLTQALQELVDWKKNGWIDDNYSTLNWRAAAERLINPAASTNRPAFFIMGDWGRGELEYLRRTLKDPDEFGSVPFPHPEGVVEDTYVFAADCFTIVRGGGNEIGASRLVDTFASLAAQLAYSKYKGSIPARMHEGSGADIDPTVEAEWKLFNADSTRRVPATSGLVPFELAGQYDDSAYRLLAEKSIDASLRFWRDWYLELQVKRGN
jgi:ABC-type glycerol-3-phosphate transport system substrate-binding protein